MNKWTLGELSGKFELLVELDGTESVPDTCKRALDELTLRGLLPSTAVIITDLAAFDLIADTVRCRVDWTAADTTGHSDRTSPEDPWLDVWSEYRQTFDLLKLSEDEAWLLVASALRTASTLGVVTDPNAVADALKEFVVVLRDRRGVIDRARDELAAAVIHLKSITIEDERQAAAIRLFGSPGAQLHSVLATLPRRILNTPE